MANNIGLYNSLSTDFYIGSTRARIYLGGNLVYPLEIRNMFTRTHLDGTVYSVECGKSGTNLNTSITLGNSSISDITGDTNPATAITIGDCVERIDYEAFRGWAKLQGDLVIPDSVTFIDSYAFNGCSGLTGDLVIPDSVTSIGLSAFSGCTGFNGRLTIGSGVTYIGQSTFRNCSGFTGDLVIPDSVTSIEMSLFYNCTGFNGRLTIGSGVTAIEQIAFEYCSGFTGDLVIPDSVTRINGLAFDECTGFNGRLSIGSGVQSIGVSAFARCSGFTGDLVIPDNVTSIGDSAFQSCSGFNGRLSIGSGVQSIGNYAFSSCSGFTGDIVIPANVTSIGQRAFNGCSGFNGILTLPSGLTSIGQYAFQNCSNLTGDLVIPDSVEDIGYYSTFEGCGGLTSVHIGTGLLKIGDYAFRDCSGFTGDLVIPDNVTRIGSGAFRNCGNLKTITIGSGVEYISQFAFMDCFNLEAIYVKTLKLDSVMIGSQAFDNTNDCPIYVPCGSGYRWYWYEDRIKEWDFDNDSECKEPEYMFTRTHLDGTTFEVECGKSGTTLSNVITRSNTTIDEISGDTNPVTAITIGDCVTEIGDSAFRYFSKVENNLVIPSGVTKINSYAFQACRGITGDLVIPDKVIDIGTQAFAYCSGFSALTFGSSVESISNQTFRDCTGFTGDLVLPDSVTSIGSATFFNCTGFNGRLTLSSGLTKINNESFRDCTGFTGDLVIPDSVTSIGNYAFNRCFGFNGKLSIGSGVQSISHYAFQACTGFTGDLVIPDSVTSIGSYTFDVCSGFTGDLVIPDSVTSIGNSAFQSCSGFNGIYIKSEIPATLGTNVFNNTTCPIYVPCGTGDAYKSATNWSTYASRIQEWDFENDSECGEDYKGYLFKRVHQDGTVFVYPATDKTITSADTMSGSSASEISGTTNPCVKVIFGDNSIYDGDTVRRLTGTIYENAFRSFTKVESIDSDQKTENMLPYVFIYNAFRGIGSGFTGDVEINLPPYDAYASISGFTFSSAYQNANSLKLTLPRREESSAITTRMFGGMGMYSEVGTELVIPSNIKTIERDGFTNCNFIGKLTFEEGIENIGNYAFQSCKNIEGDLVFPDSLSTIGEDAFNGQLNKVDSITFGEGLTTIGYSAFVLKTGSTVNVSDYRLKKITYNCKVPPLVSSIPSVNAYHTPPIYVPNESLDSYLESTSFKGVSSRVTSEKEMADRSYLYYCEQYADKPTTIVNYNKYSVYINHKSSNVLASGDTFTHYGNTKVNIGVNVTTINSRGVSNNSVYCVDIGENVNSIASSGVVSTSLEKVYCRAVIPPSIQANSLRKSSANYTGVVYVPCGSVDAYKSATNWTNYTIIGYDFDNDKVCDG